MNDKAPGLFDFLILWGSLALTWISGETGRVIVASGMGGLSRWLVAEKKRIRDGVLSVIGGVIVGKNMWPAVLAAPDWLPEWMGASALEPTPDNIAMAAFVAGTVGMSAIKIGTALFEAYGMSLVARVRKPGDVE